MTSSLLPGTPGSVVSVGPEGRDERILLEVEKHSKSPSGKAQINHVETAGTSGSNSSCTLVQLPRPVVSKLAQGQLDAGAVSRAVTGNHSQNGGSGNPDDLEIETDMIVDLEKGVLR